MQQKGFVSLWLGKVKSYEEIDKYLSSTYDEDGDSIDSDFEKDFKIEYFDEDFRDAFYKGSYTKNIKELLSGCSYEGSVIPAFENKYGQLQQEDFNSGFLLYDFNYCGRVFEIRKGQFYIKYIGTVEYIQK